jgi:hypothetical protein
MAAYFYLPRQPGERSQATKRFEHGLVVDFAPSGRAIGVEITSPRTTTLAQLNEALASVGVPSATIDEVSPVVAAS